MYVYDIYIYLYLYIELLLYLLLWFDVGHVQMSIHVEFFNMPKLWLACYNQWTIMLCGLKAITLDPTRKKTHRQPKKCCLSINCWDTLQQFHNLRKSPLMYFFPRRSRTSLGAENRTVSADFPSWPDGIYQVGWKFQWPRNMETCNNSLYCIYVEGTFMYRMTVLEISLYHSRIMIYDGRWF